MIPDPETRRQALADRARRKWKIAKTLILPGARAAFLDPMAAASAPSEPAGGDSTPAGGTSASSAGPLAEAAATDPSGVEKTKILALPWAEFLFDENAIARRQPGGGGG
jgi:hypothetical protein